MSLNKQVYITICFLVFCSFPILNNCFLFAQSKKNTSYYSILDSVKKIYGDSCTIGVNSSLIKKLYTFKKYAPVKNYLESYENIHKKINDFRHHYINNIENDEEMLLDISRIFGNQKYQNFVNACGIYFGADSVTNIALSYMIVRSNITNLYAKIFHLIIFDKTYKYELSITGKDWYYSLKLKELKN
jgi:hypothetical protein